MDRNYLTLGSAASLLIAATVMATASFSTSALAAGGQSLTFQGDASFNGPHGGQAIKAALVDTASGEVLAVQSGTVSADGDPAFSFTYPDALQAGDSYAVDYWIDSNFGGGTVGTCDSMQHDHQWHIPIEVGDGSTTHVESHNPSAMSPVCASFE